MLMTMKVRAREEVGEDVDSTRAMYRLDREIVLNGHREEQTQESSESRTPGRLSVDNVDIRTVIYIK
jgi:hypothetical protein